MRRVFELPMRDGNNVILKGAKRPHRMFLNFLWGMETRKCGNRPFNFIMFLNFLWGMETKHGVYVSEVPTSVFELPMRDGNMLGHVYPSCPCACFWTSYEGWKPVFIWHDSRTDGLFLNFLWGMETQCRTVRMGIRTPVFELPMRDGNRAHPKHRNRPILVFELPMRDGN